MVSLCLAFGNELHHVHPHSLIISLKCCYHNMDKTSSLTGLLLWKKKNNQKYFASLTLHSTAMSVSWTFYQSKKLNFSHISQQSFGWDICLTSSIITKIQVTAIFLKLDMQRNFLPKFIEICMGTPYWCPSGWSPTWRPETNRNNCHWVLLQKAWICLEEVKIIKAQWNFVNATTLRPWETVRINGMVVLRTH